MKTSVKNIFLAIGATAVLASCGENSWNDHLDGFEPGVNYNNAIEGAFTMTAADYSAVASNATNKQLAETAGVANALKAVGTNGMFSAEAPAKEYLPAFLASSSAPYFVAPEGSKINVTYVETGATDPIIASIAGANTYTVSKADYINAWGSDEDYINAFAPMTSAQSKLPNILKEAYPDADAGSYAVVSYNESATNPVFITSGDVEKFEGGMFYLVADGPVGAAPLAATYKYGYLQQAEASVANGTATCDNLNAFTFVPTDGGYYIMDAYGRFLYMSGTYNSFNVSASLPESGAVWTVDVASNGQATITNATTNKWIQYDGGYSSWGSYDSERGSLPVLYKAAAPEFYIVTEEGHGAGPVAADKTYGYLASVDMTVANGIVATDAANAFTFEMTAGGYNIKDSYGRYLYMKGTYTSFNLSNDVPEEGGVWTLAADASGAIKIANAETGKTMQFDSKYNSWGAYDDVTNALPKLYNAAAKAVASKPAKVVASTPVTASMTAVYTFDGSKWAAAEGVVALDAADYAAMGFDNNKLENAATYLPLYMKASKPYAVEGDTEAVVYNGTACAVLVYDGQNWTVNDNDQQTLTGQFVKNKDGWAFVKYVGKSYFNLTTELVLDRQYLMVAQTICAVPIKAASNYGYLYTADVTIVNDVIEQPNEANAFTFASTVEVDGKEYKLPEGQFVIVDSNNRYLYMSGTFNSFNVADAPAAADGSIDAGYVWTAEHVADGAWTVKNVGNGKWIQYAINYSSFGCYDVEQNNSVLPSLYMIAGE